VSEYGWRNDRIVVTEHIEVIPVPYTYMGEQRFRTKRRNLYTVYCRDCEANTDARLYTDARQWARDHQCPAHPEDA
jgi:hypothetical protein